MNKLLHIAEPSRILSVEKQEEASTNWRTLELFNLYRLALVLILGFLIFFGREHTYIGTAMPGLAAAATLGYFAFSVLSLLSLRLHQPSFYVQTYSQVLVDILYITVLMHASGGIESGLGMLINIVIAGGAIIVPGRIAHLFAAMATIAILGEQIFDQLAGLASISYSHAGMLGASYFATATMAYVLAKRIRASEDLAQQRGIDLEDLARLNEHIIRELDSGIIVIDDQVQVRQLNAATEKMLGRPIDNKRMPLEIISSQLAGEYLAWLQNNHYQPQAVELGKNNVRVRPRFIRLQRGTRHHGTLIFLQDIGFMMQQVQQMKLASLGQLTASIAHEIRNPLGAISHAGQLLQESATISADDRRLTEIIRNHCLRVNTIIENILQLSRREQFLPERLQLKPWLERFVEELRREQHLQADEVLIVLDDPDTGILIDPSQLHQIISNLAENGLRHSPGDGKNPRLEFHVQQDPENHSVIMDIIDNGPGIPADNIQHIFEPFFTTQSTGTGLGLYICRELCEINQARINYLNTHEGKSCFRIYFTGQ